jgi:hypothetical protein
MYKQVLQLRYGISNCCPEEDERYIIQKELIDLQAMIPPDETPSPPPPPPPPPPVVNIYTIWTTFRAL